MSLIFLSPKRSLHFEVIELECYSLSLLRELGGKVAEVEPVISEVTETKPAQNVVYKLTFSELSFWLVYLV